MRTRLVVPAVLFALALATSPVAAITRGGVPDAGEHPMTGQLLFYVPDAQNTFYENTTGGWYNCTGTLVNSTVIVTAGHCTFGIGDGGYSTTHGGVDTTAGAGGVGGTDVWVSFGEDDSAYDGWPKTRDPATGALNYPNERARYEARRNFLNSKSFWHKGTAYPHPQYDDVAFYLHDAGVVVLSASVAGPYASVASQGYLDQYASSKGRQAPLLEVAGYGLERVTGAGVEGGDTRRKAEVKLMSLKSTPADTYIKLSNNAKTGGTCFGDSGGPTFADTDSVVIVAVTSFGVTPNCTGSGYAYRIDQPDDLEFFASHGVTVDRGGDDARSGGARSAGRTNGASRSASAPGRVVSEAKAGQRTHGLRPLVPGIGAARADDRAFVTLPR